MVGFSGYKNECFHASQGVTQAVRETNGVSNVSIVRIGLAETRNFSAGYDAIFGNKAAPGKTKGKAKDKPKARKGGEAPKPKAAKKKK